MSQSHTGEKVPYPTLPPLSSPHPPGILHQYDVVGEEIDYNDDDDELGSLRKALQNTLTVNRTMQSRILQLEMSSKQAENFAIDIPVLKNESWPLYKNLHEYAAALQNQDADYHARHSRNDRRNENQTASSTGNRALGKSTTFVSTQNDTSSVPINAPRHFSSSTAPTNHQTCHPVPINELDHLAEQEYDEEFLNSDNDAHLEKGKENAATFGNHELANVTINETSNVSNSPFYFDTCATSHMCPYPERFQHLSVCSGLVTSSSGASMSVKGKGTVKINCKLSDGKISTFCLTNVLYIPELNLPLISWQKLSLKGYKLHAYEKQSVGEGTAASQLEKAYKNILEKEKQLLLSSKELEDAKEGLKELEKSSGTTTVLGKLADVLDRLQIPNHKSAIIHSGGVFNGDKILIPIWKEGILLKLKSNADHFPTEQSRMAFVYSMLDQDCQSHLHRFIKGGVIHFESFDKMMNKLTILFDDPNRVRDATARLHANNQRNKPFSSWIAEIRRDASIAGYESSRELRNIVFLNLNLELQQALIYERDIYSLEFNEAVARLQDIDNRLQTFSRNMARYKTRGNQGIFSRNIPSPSLPLTTTQGGDAMDLSAVSPKPRGPLSDEEKDRR
ncbi:hypothetical protein EPUL_002924, partial [Erysiphe pulchra]